jgi:hypothetical protein
VGTSFIHKSELKGLGAGLSALAGLETVSVRALGVGLSRIAVACLKRSQSYVPVDTGFLKSTGDVTTRGDGQDLQALITYSAPYAVFVHENLAAYHEPPTGAKFLERGIQETMAVEARHILFDVFSQVAVTGTGLTEFRVMETAEFRLEPGVPRSRAATRLRGA